MLLALIEQVDDVWVRAFIKVKVWASWGMAHALVPLGGVELFGLICNLPLGICPFNNEAAAPN